MNGAGQGKSPARCIFLSLNCWIRRLLGAEHLGEGNLEPQSPAEETHGRMRVNRGGKQRAMWG